MSMFTFSGLASGIDSESIIKQLVAIKRLPIVRLEDRKDLFQRQKSALSDLKTKLQTLEDAVKALDTAREFGSLAASSTQEDLLTVTANGLANPGNHEIVIGNLATYQRDVYQGIGSLDENVGSGTIRITIDRQTHEIDLTDPVNTLGQLRDAINDAGIGVYASIMNDGSDATPYRLVMTSSESGEDAAFTADLGGVVGGTALTVDSTTAGQDAALTIDGIAVTSASNAISDAITGLTFNLHRADETASINVAVETDAEAITAKMQTLVDSYNDIFSYLSAQDEEEGTLRGQPVLDTVERRLQSLFVHPLEGGSGDLTLMAQVGISQGEGGQLDFDQTEFEEALAENFSGVRDLFVERGENLGKAYLIRQSMEDLTSAEGVFKISNQALNRRIKNADDTIARYERSVETYQDTLRRKFTGMETLMAGLQAQGQYLAATLSGIRN